MLAVIEQKQHLLRAKEAHQFASTGLVSGDGVCERCGDGRWNEGGFRHGRQVNPDHAVSEVLGDLLRDGKRQPRLADATGTGQRQKRDGLIEQEGAGRGQLLVSTNERRARVRQRTRSDQPWRVHSLRTIADQVSGFGTGVDAERGRSPGCVATKPWYL